MLTIPVERNIVLPILLLLVLCPLSHATPKNGAFKVGVCEVSDEAWFEKIETEMCQEVLFHPEMELIFRKAHNNRDLQCDQIDSFVTERVDMIIMGPTDDPSICEALNCAYDAGIPVVMTSHYDIGEKYTAFICMSNEEIGHAFADFLIQVAQREQCSVTHPLEAIEIIGPRDIHPTILRNKGLHQGLKNHPEIHIVTTCVADWKRLRAKELTDSILTIHPEVRAIVAQNDEMAIGASYACEEKGILPLVHIMGVDAMGGKDAGVKAILNNKIEASVMSTSRGDLVIKTAAAILNSTPYNRQTYLPVVTVTATSPQLMLRMAEEIDASQEAIGVLKDTINNQWSISDWQHLTILVLVVSVFILMVLWIGIRNVRKYRERIREQLEQNSQIVRQQQEQLNVVTQELAKTKEIPSANEHFVKQIQGFIQQNIDNSELSIEDIQKSLGVSRTQLFRLTKLTMGTTPIELIRHIRLHKARNLLKSTNLSIQEVAYSVGFTSPSYFTKCYRKEFGHSPSESNRQ